MRNTETQQVRLPDNTLVGSDGKAIFTEKSTVATVKNTYDWDGRIFVKVEYWIDGNRREATWALDRVEVI